MIREVKFLSVWTGGLGEIVGTEITRGEYEQTRRFAPNPQGWLFAGSWATVRVINPTGDLSRVDALKFTTDWMYGNVTHYNVDLDRCTVAISGGTKQPPHH